MYICEFTCASHKVLEHFYNTDLLFPVRFLLCGLKKKTPKLELTEIIFLLKFQKTGIFFSHPLWGHQIMKYLMTQMQTSQIICDVSRSSMDGAGHYLHLFSYSRAALTPLSWSCQGSTNLSSSKKQLFVHVGPHTR